MKIDHRLEALLLCILALNVTARVWIWIAHGVTINPGVAIAATTLAIFAYFRGQGAPVSSRGETEHPSRAVFTRYMHQRVWFMRLIGLTLSLGGGSLSWCTYEHLAFMSLDPTHLQLSHLGLILEGLGVIALWSAYTWARGLDLWGVERSRRLHFPISIAVFGLPWEGVLRTLDLPLQRLSADLAVMILDLSDLLGLSTAHVRYWDSFTIYSDQFYLIVNETCAGVNLLLSMSLYALGFGWTMGVSLTRAWILIAYIIPLSICFNGVRVAIIFMLGHTGSVELATGPWHEGSGYLCQLLLFIVLALLNMWLGPSTPRSRVNVNNA